MKSKTHELYGKEPNQDWQIEEYLALQPPSPRLGKIMTIAILPVGDIEKQIAQFKPYRTFKAVGLDEFLNFCLFLESIDFDCLNKHSDAINGYDAVFHVAAYELKFYDDKFIEENSRHLRSLLTKKKNHSD